MNVKTLFATNNIDETKLDKTLKTVKIINGIISAFGLIWYIAMIIKVYRSLYKTTEDVKSEKSLAAKERGLDCAKKRVEKYNKLVEKYHSLWQQAKNDEKFYSNYYVDSKGNLCHKDSEETPTTEEKPSMETPFGKVYRSAKEYENDHADNGTVPEPILPVK